MLECRTQRRHLSNFTQVMTRVGAVSFFGSMRAAKLKKSCCSRSYWKMKILRSRLVRGPGGAGKSIALKRTAFEAATASNALVLWLNDDGALRPEIFFEIYELTTATIYLFVDQLALHVDKVYALFKYAQQKHLPIIIVGAEREADWNTYCGSLEDFDPIEKRIGNLSTDETRNLLDLLGRHSCLGLLSERNFDERVEAFMGRADRQLLVALHELTQGKPFEEIVFSEHQNVHPEQARQLYLDIATMHQFGVNIRAGTITRISGIDFEDYQRDFFHPLENIVRIQTDKYSGDYVYRTRQLPRCVTRIQTGVPG
jgi:hypothetical protein